MALKDYLFYAVTVLIWGTTFYGIRLQPGSVLEEGSVTYRFSLAVAILIAYCLVQGRFLRLPLRAHAPHRPFGDIAFSPELHRHLLRHGLYRERAEPGSSRRRDHLSRQYHGGLHPSGRVSLPFRPSPSIWRTVSPSWPR